jgi:hypothetical protein
MLIWLKKSTAAAKGKMAEKTDFPGLFTQVLYYQIHNIQKQ